MGVPQQYTRIWPPLYRFVILQWLDTVTDWLRFPFRRASDQFLSCFFFTTVELNHPLWQLWVYIVLMPTCFIGLVLSLPLALMGWLPWLLIRRLRLKYITSHSWSIPCKRLGKDANAYQPHVCTFATANLNLVPEWMARYNNFTGSRKRGREIGRLLAAQQLECKSVENNYWKSTISTMQDRPIAHKFLPRSLRKDETDAQFDTEILTKFPPLDFLMIQEGCWDIDIGRDLVQELHRVYPEIVYDAGEFGYGVNKCIANSGLMIASKYEILEVDFKAFEDFCFQDVISSKGLLQVMVKLGQVRSSGEEVVGYIYNTHLQAHQGTNPVHSKQLHCITQWTQEFRQRTTRPNRIVAFDVVAGDFNLDNLSPVDERDWYNSLFNVHYRDLGRKKPGEDQDWAVGTEMRHPCIHDQNMATPQGLKAIMELPEQRNYYFLAGDIENASMDMAKKLVPTDELGSYVYGKNAGKRRIDYVLYKEMDGAKPVAFCPVTQLANLTDHVPYMLALKLAQCKCAGL